MPHIHKYFFGGADIAASTTNAALPILGEPDTADISSIPAPKPLRLVGVTLVNKNASTDTTQVQVTKNGSTAVVGPTLLNSAALGTQQNVYLGPADAVQFAIGDKIGMAYKTTTAGTYTVNDTYAEAIFEDFDD